MIILDNIHTKISPARPCALTIGSYDGVHLGHQRILQRMREKVGPHGTVCVLTFSNHPSHVLSSKKPTRLITSQEIKLELLEKYGVDIVVCLLFTKELAAKSYETFLRELPFSFDFLLLGEGDCFGKNREGTPEKVTQLGKTMGFEAVYLPKVTQAEGIISSGKIRACIQKRDLKKAKQLLGHPFIIEGKVTEQKLLITEHFCLPPDGTYDVVIQKVSSDLCPKKEKIQIEQHCIRFLSQISEEKFRLIFD